MDSKRGARAATAVGVIIAAGIAGTGVASAEAAPAAAHGTAQRITSMAQLREGIQQAVTAERSSVAPDLATRPVGLAADALAVVKAPQFSTTPAGYFTV
jgi:hexokinase